MTSTHGDWLSERARDMPSRDALVAAGRSWSFAELDAEVTALTLRLASLGVTEGGRVATLLHNGPLAAMLVHATLRLGATLVPLNTRLGAAEVAWQVQDAEPRIVVAEARTRALAATSGAAIVMDEVLIAPRAGNGDDATDSGAGDSARGGHTPPQGGGRTALRLELEHPADRVLAILYTSGTTGRPKGAMLTVANFRASADASARNLGTRDDDRWLACLPLFHVGGLSILMRSVIHGLTAVVHDGFDEHLVNRAIDDERVTLVSVVAVMLQRLLDARGARPFPPTLRCVLLGGGPAPRALLERAAARGAPVVQTYGLTETTSQLATLAPADALRKLGAAGRALPPSELRIDATPGGPPGEGEILVRGPVVMAGYWRQPEATARALAGGWLHTGDVGRLDDEGFLYVLDRRDDLVITGGENVYPAEVESVLGAHPWVAECGVIGAPDAQWGQRVMAVVRLADDADATRAPHALIAHCRASLASYKCPREVIVVTEPLPRTASGKLQRAALRSRIA